MQRVLSVLALCGALSYAPDCSAAEAPAEPPARLGEFDLDAAQTRASRAQIYELSYWLSAALMFGSIIVYDTASPLPPRLAPVVVGTLVVGGVANIGSLSAFSVQTFRAARVSGSTKSMAWASASLGMHLAGMAATIGTVAYVSRRPEELLPGALGVSGILLVPAGYFSGVIALQHTLNAIDQKAWSPLHRFMVRPMLRADGGGVVAVVQW